MWAYSDHRGQLSLLFATDLDNTLLFSKKHRKPGDHCVEWLDGKEQGYFSTETIRLLRLIAARAEIIPITTRSIAQYQRIVWPKGCRPRRAITTNGAYLFEDNTPVPAWRETMRASAEDYAEICRQLARYKTDTRFRRCRIVDTSYLFLYCKDDVAIAKTAAELQSTTSLKVEPSGSKIYLLPRGLNKGAAFRRLKAACSKNIVRTFAAGDTPMDLPMLQEADCGFYPHKAVGAKGLCIWNGKEHYAEWLLQKVLEALKRLQSPAL